MTDPKTYTDPIQAPKARDGGPPDAWLRTSKDGLLEVGMARMSDGAVVSIYPRPDTVSIDPLYTADRAPCDCDELRRVKAQQDVMIERLEIQRDTATDEVEQLRAELAAAQQDRDEAVTEAARLREQVQDLQRRYEDAQQDKAALINKGWDLTP